MAIAGSSTHLINIIRNIHKPSIAQPSRQPRRHIHRLPKLFTRAIQPILPIHNPRRAFMRPIITIHQGLKLLRLKPGPRLEVCIRLPQQPRPIGDPAAQAPRVNVIECFGRRECPVGLGVVDEEAAVGRGPGGLDRGEVCAEDGACGEVFGHFDGPFGGAGADVEDAGGRGAGVVVVSGEGGTVQVAAGEEFEEVVH